MAEGTPKPSAQTLCATGSPRPIHSPRLGAGYRDNAACPARFPPAPPAPAEVLQAVRVRRAGCNGCGAGGGGGCGRPRCSCGSGSSPRTAHCRVQPQRRPKLKRRIPGNQSRDANPKCILFNRSLGKGSVWGVTSVRKRGEPQDSTTNLGRAWAAASLRLPIPTYHGASEGRKSGAGEGGYTSAGAVTAEVPPLLLLLLLRRYLRCALSLSRRPTASNGTANTRLPTPLP